MNFLINQIVLAFWNLVNSRIDAYRILKHKGIAHGINFGAYVLLVGILCWLGRYDVKTIILFSVSAFLNRQFSFDIPLNKRRGLHWYYQSTAQPPNSYLDRIERFIFGSHPLVGIKIAITYWIIYGNVIAFYFYSK